MPQNIDGTLRLTATKNDFWLDGLTTIDVVLIQRHILFISPIIYPESQIAGDLNNDAELSTFDVTLLRDLILLNETETNFTNSWRFLPTWTVINMPGFISHWGAVPTDPYNVTPFNLDLGFGLGNFEYPLYLDMPLEFFWLSTNDQFDLGFFSFNAIKVGDVNHSNEQNLTENEESVTRNVKQSFILDTAFYIKKGEEVTIPIKVDNLGEINAYQFGIWLSPDDFELLDILEGDLSSFTKDNFGLTKLDQGEIRTLWFDNEAKNVDLSEETILFNLRIKAKRNIFDISEKIKIDKNIMPCVYYDSEDKEITFNLEIKNKTNSILDEKIQAFDQYPNPVNGQMTLEFLLGNETELQIEILDVLGNELKNYSETGIKGLNRILLKNLNDLPNGAHFIRLITPDGYVVTKQFLKLN